MHLYLPLSVSLAIIFVVAATAEHVRYIVLGAGPGGLQIAHYLESARREYVVLERAAHAASFFERYPRWRQLISINKREVGRTDSLAFAERHDWNSLLSDASHSAAERPITSLSDARLTAESIDPRLRFTSWSDAYFPYAGDLSAYMQAWAATGASDSNHQGRSHIPAQGRGRIRPLRVRYGVDVRRIDRPHGWTDARSPDAVDRGEPRFELVTADGSTLTCTFLIVATGLEEAVPMPGVNGTAAVASGLVQTYASASAETAAYRGKRILILGHGNAAFEFAHHVLPVAAYVHVAGRSTQRLQMALETHYPGHVRAVHAGLLESYNLKSLDGLTSANFSRLEFSCAPDGGISVRNGASPCRSDALGRPTTRCRCEEVLGWGQLNGTGAKL
jgi:cation diffusion facilitator CzcD-associated flavoprotein CzcO